jgi:hypothetical protein
MEKIKIYENYNNWEEGQDLVGYYDCVKVDGGYDAVHFYSDCGIDFECGDGYIGGYQFFSDDEDCVFYGIANARYHDKNDKLVSFEEMKNYLNTL